MEKILERAGVWAVIAILAIVIVAYSLWGATMIKAERQGGAFSQTQGVSFTANL
jgi:hypothetical protein